MQLVLTVVAQQKLVYKILLMETINSRIKQRREALGLSMQQLADLVRVSAWQTVQQWEKEGGTAPKRSRLEAVASALQTRPEVLLYGAERIHEIADTIRQTYSTTDKLRDKLSLEAVWVGNAFDNLLTEEQREAVIMQLRAFNPGALNTEILKMVKIIPQKLPPK